MYLLYMTYEAGLRVCVCVGVRGVCPSREVSLFFLVRKDCEYVSGSGGEVALPSSQKGTGYPLGARMMPFVVFAVYGR